MRAYDFRIQKIYRLQPGSNPQSQAYEAENSQSSIVLRNATAVSYGLDSNPEEDMVICKSIVQRIVCTTR
ncbi:hypothetical protein TNCV_4154221 [Trichonephila clavipes]|nr:hypothetical protein TNCV_4154221 [Trichonephila clavipes]